MMSEKVREALNNPATAHLPMEIYLTRRSCLAAHRHSRRHHRIECQCPSCRWSGSESCSERNPCSYCLTEGANV